MKTNSGIKFLFISLPSLKPMSSALRRSRKRRLSSLFLKSHGLRDPLTAIVWGSNCLRHAEDRMMTQAQQRYFSQNVYLHSKILSSMVESIVLLSEQEEGMQRAKETSICLADFLHHITDDFESLQGGYWDMQSH